MKYTHRLRIDTTQLKCRYNFDDDLAENYYKDGYLYGYYADGVLLGELVEINEEYVAFEYWLKPHNEIEELEE